MRIRYDAKFAQSTFLQQSAQGDAIKIKYMLRSLYDGQRFPISFRQKLPMSGAATTKQPPERRWVSNDWMNACG